MSSGDPTADCYGLIACSLYGLLLPRFRRLCWGFSGRTNRGYGLRHCLDSGGVSFTCMRYYAFYLAKLVDERIDRRLLNSAMLKSILNPILHCIAVLLALIDTRLAIALYIVLPLMFFIPSKLERYVHSGETEGR